MKRQSATMKIRIWAISLRILPLSCHWILQRHSLRSATHDVLAGLTTREAKVLRMRFGIDMNTDHTLEEVGKQFDVTREHVSVGSKRKRCVNCATQAAPKLLRSFPGRLILLRRNPANKSRLSRNGGAFHCILLKSSLLPFSAS
ncbi:sigma factor-like helix-turn-helix DNA-binding protein [Rahnella perminowiae]|uniref:sigma factor-like helix-turn-helix DNA-binding protein n=1 Tax=Rahnella perminowiae TaxID=2816244 RepID=UPI003B8A7706